MKKTYVLDTNVLLIDSRAIYSMADNTVVILGTVLQELDKLKIAPGETGFHAREAIRELESVRRLGHIVSGIPSSGGGTIKVEPDGVRAENLPLGYDISVPDNRIISACLSLQKQSADQPVILVSDDVSMRINAAACGLEVQAYKNAQSREVKLTEGIRQKKLTADQIDELYRDGTSALRSRTLKANDLVTAVNGQQSALTYYRNGALHLITPDMYGPAYGLKPLNAMQKYALWALMAPANEIPLVVMIGPAGTAKTILSLAAGLQQVRSKQYDKVFLSRPSGGSYEKIGFLPGDLQEKLSPLYASFYDNLEALLRTPAKSSNGQQKPKEKIASLIDDGTIEIGSLDFIRGRSLTNTYLICDEAQNATRSLIRDVITRAGQGTKVVLAGDPNQIDVPNLDSRSNGLSYAAEAMHGSDLCAVITFGAGQTVRSALSKEAVQRLKI